MAREYRILIVEDDREVAALLATFFRDHEHVVSVAHDGSTALVALRSLPVDVILLDMVMQPMNGLTFLEYKAADPTLAGIPVIVTTGYIESLTTLPACVRKVFGKPFALGELRAAVEAILAESQVCQAGQEGVG